MDGEHLSLTAGLAVDSRSQSSWAHDEVYNQHAPLVVAQLQSSDAPNAPATNAAQPEAPKASSSDLPNRFELNEHFFSSTIGWETFDVNNQTGQKVGEIDRTFWSWTPEFSLYDNASKLQAVGKTEYFSWGTTNDIDDGDGHRLGTFKKEIINSLLGFGVTNRYTLLDGQGNAVGTSDKSQFLATDMTLKDNSGAIIATAHRPWFNWFGDKWDVQIVKPGVIDPRVVALLPAFKTAGDNKKSSDSGSSSSKKK